MEYAIPKEIYAEDLKYVRSLFHMSQREFAAFIGVSKPTVERWEGSDKAITGPVVMLLELLRKNPDIEKTLRVPEKKYPVRLRYYYKRMLCTIIDVDEMKEQVEIHNYTDNRQFCAFGVNEHPSYQEYQDFLESRCFPRERDKMKIMLKALDLPFYDPFMIIEKTNGRMAEDDFWIEIER